MAQPRPGPGAGLFPVGGEEPLPLGSPASLNLVLQVPGARGHLLQYPGELPCSPSTACLSLRTWVRAHWGATPPRLPSTVPRAWVALLRPAQSLNTPVALVSPLAPPILTAHSFPLLPAQVSSGGPGIMGSASSLEPPLAWKWSPVSSGVGWGSPAIPMKPVQDCAALKTLKQRWPLYHCLRSPARASS